jgi:two-component system, cell cycle sensor histidine kinase and response regulator CckA
VDGSDTLPDLSLLQRVLPEGCGVVVYTRASAPPWELRSVVGDGPGVLGVPTRALDQVWGELVHPEDEPRLRTVLTGLRAGDRLSLDYRVRTAMGGERWVRDSFQRLPGNAGLVLGAMRDVSVERTLRAQIAALEERIWQAQRVDSLGGLATGIAHDLGNLLTAILSSVQLVEDSGQLPPLVLDDLAVARESAKRGSDFVRQILRFAAREGYQPGPVDVNGVVEDLRLILGRSLGADVRLVINKTPDLPRISCDPGQLEQVVLNLTVNAREAMPIGGQIAISTRLQRISARFPMQGVTLPPGDYVVLSVSDSGRGIPEQVKRRIFEPFFSTKTRKGSGSGFGLSTVQRIVRGHGGGVDVESIEGEGTTFHIYLPVQAAPAGFSEMVAGPTTMRETPSLGRVLVAEHEPSIRELIKRVLAREGYSVMGVATAQEALRLFDRVRPPFDLIIAEVTLPDRSGIELVRLLRNRLTRLSVVYVGGALSAGAPDDPGSVYLSKPFTPLALLSTVQRALPTSSEKAGASREA